MAYRIAGIDVHKKMVAVVIADVEIAETWRFERRLLPARGHPGRLHHPGGERHLLPHPASRRLLKSWVLP